MASYRARRAAEPSRAVRVARITVPALVVGTLATGVAVAAWPSGESLSAVPAPSTETSATPADRAVPDRATRDQARPAPSALPSDSPFARDTTSAADKAAKAKAAKAAADKAAAAQAKTQAKPQARTQSRAKAPVARQTEKVAAARAEPKLDLSVIGSRYLTEDLRLRAEPESDAKVIDVLDARTKVSVTDTVQGGYRLIVRDGKGRWVTDRYLAKKQPAKETAISDQSCDKSSSIESGLVPNGIKVYRALCAKFPQISSFGGRRSANGGFHPTGQAVDAMVSNGGQEIANWLRANAGRLGVSEVIYAQQIWTVQRSGEGWRGMSDRGNATANHYDHVHVSVY